MAKNRPIGRDADARRGSRAAHAAATQGSAVKPRTKRRLETLRSVTALSAAGLIAPAEAPRLEAVARRYALAMTPELARLVVRGEPSDPIARQFVPDARELVRQPRERDDPLGEAALSPLPDVVHRYRDRVLVKLTHVCPVYCRFCFRREVVGPNGRKSLAGEALEAAVGYIAGDRRIWEVILTGGDPFMLSPRRIGDVTRRLSAIAHVKVLRWHTRVPIADPARVSDALVAAVRATQQTVCVAVHANHARELTREARRACARLIDAGVPLFAQTVLLKGVNDDVDTLESLMRALVEARIKPYYLHHADLAPGTGHFRTSIGEGQALMRALRGRLSGIAQPTYVLDIPGGRGKVPIGPSYLSPDGGSVSAPDGSIHDYADRG
jgi:lysine 2,3-aminomutase